MQVLAFLQNFLSGSWLDMLVYAIILILVMLATNSPTIRQAIDVINPVRRYKHWKKHQAKAAANVAGGDRK